MCIRLIKKSTTKASHYVIKQQGFYTRLTNFILKGFKKLKEKKFIITQTV